MTVLPDPKFNMEFMTKREMSKKRKNQQENGGSGYERWLRTLDIDHEKAKKEAEEQFDKRFDYEKNEEWSLYQSKLKLKQRCKEKEEKLDFDECFMKLKSDLIRVKTALNDKDPLAWREFTGQTHRGSQVRVDVKRRMNPELCTQAWCKFREIVSLVTSRFTSSIPSGDASANHVVRTVHLCEAPGAFVTSLNHFLLNADFQGDWSWIGASMNPFHEGEFLDKMITDDRLIFNSLANWEFGPDNVGNLMDRRSLKALIDRVSAQETTGGRPETTASPSGDAAAASSTGDTLMPAVGVDLVTADGSVNCADDPSEQESIVASLHWCEAVAALYLLAEGGTFVLKMFTLFEESSICLMFLLNCVFDEVTVFKPATSKAGNSECYVVCQGFSDRRSWLGRFAPIFWQHYGPNLSSHATQMVLDLVPLSFLRAHLQGVAVFQDLQKKCILDNLAVHQLEDEASFNAATHYIEFVQTQVSHLFFKETRVKPIRMFHHLIPKERMKSTPLYSQTHRYQLEGSYNERRESVHLPWPKRIKTCIPQNYSSIGIPFSVSWKYALMPLPDPEDIRTCHKIFGKRPVVVKNSIFCDPRVTRDWNMAVRESALPVSLIASMDADTVDHMARSFVEDYAKYIDAGKSCDYITVDEAGDETYEVFLQNGGRVIHYLNCVNLATVVQKGLAYEEFSSQSLMVSSLKRIFCDKLITKGCDLLLNIPTIYSRFSASFICLLTFYFDVWGMGMVDNYTRDVQEQSASPSSALPSFFFFGSGFRLDRDAHHHEPHFDAVRDLIKSIAPLHSNSNESLSLLAGKDSTSKTTSTTLKTSETQIPVSLDRRLSPHQSLSAITSLDADALTVAPSESNVTISSTDSSLDSTTGYSSQVQSSASEGDVAEGVGGEEGVEGAEGVERVEGAGGVEGVLSSTSLSSITSSTTASTLPSSESPSRSPVSPSLPASPPSASKFHRPVSPSPPSPPSPPSKLPPDRDLLQFMPLEALTASGFLCYLRACNAALAQKRLNFLIEWENREEERERKEEEDEETDADSDRRRRQSDNQPITFVDAP